MTAELTFRKINTSPTEKGSKIIMATPCCVRTYVWIIYICVYIYVHFLHIYVDINVHVCTWSIAIATPCRVCMYAYCTHAYIYVYMCLHICIHINAYVCIWSTAMAIARCVITIDRCVVTIIIQTMRYRVARMCRMLYHYMSFFAKEPYN